MKLSLFIQRIWNNPVWSAVIATLIISCIFYFKTVFCSWWNKTNQSWITLKYEITDENGYPTQDVFLTIYDSTYILKKNNSEILILDKNDSVISITYSKQGYITVTTQHLLYMNLPFNISLRKLKKDE